VLEKSEGRATSLNIVRNKEGKKMREIRREEEGREKRKEEGKTKVWKWVESKVMGKSGKDGAMYGRRLGSAMDSEEECFESELVNRLKET
jgi:hypothetical protein